MKTSSKAIGNQYEREISYKLSEWLTGEKDADVCWRDVGSGNRYTKRKKQGKETARKADIVATDLKYDPFFKLFYIDSKSYKQFYPLIINTSNIKSNSIFHQWVKTVEECPENMIPMMPTKIRDGKKTEFIILPEYINCNFVNNMFYIVNFNNKIYQFYLVFQEEFFKHNKWEDFYKNNLTSP